VTVALPRRAVLALLAVTDIALNARGALVSARDVAERHALPPRHFETILQDLTRAGLIKGQRGPKGGYRLARERRKITVADVVRAVGLADPAEALPETMLARLVEPALTAGERALFDALGTITIEDMLGGVGAEAVAGTDFTI